MGRADDMLVRDARDLARTLLPTRRPERWLHTRGKAGRVVKLVGTVRKKDRAVLIAAAWLHDTAIVTTSCNASSTVAQPSAGWKALGSRRWASPSRQGPICR